jgi:hypothetical protein
MSVLESLHQKPVRPEQNEAGDGAAVGDGALQASGVPGGLTRQPLPPQLDSTRSSPLTQRMSLFLSSEQ